MMMKAIEITQTGGPEVMQMRDLASPEPQHGEVLIRVAASGINFIDLFVREGRYGNQTPFTPGQEASGIVESVGLGVTDLKRGDRVAWCSVLGTYAEYAVAPPGEWCLSPTMSRSTGRRRSAPGHDRSLPFAICIRNSAGG
jgi:NADPH2:quinone reductase